MLVLLSVIVIIVLAIIAFLLLVSLLLVGLALVILCVLRRKKCKSNSFSYLLSDKIQSVIIKIFTSEIVLILIIESK